MTNRDEIANINEQLLKVWQSMTTHLATGFELLILSQKELRESCKYMEEFEAMWSFICCNLPESEDKKRAANIASGLQSFRLSVEDCTKGWEELSETFHMIVDSKPFWVTE